MDRFIAAMPAVRDGDLMLAVRHGVAWQADMTVTARYDARYLAKCAGYEGSDIAERINAARIAMVDRYAEGCAVLDIGVGSGEFVRRRPNTFGYDINPAAMAWLKASRRWSEAFDSFTAFCFWDVLEHVPEPETYFRPMPAGSYVFVSIPVFADLARIRTSRHYRPGEHLYYFTAQGFMDWMAMHGLLCLERRDDETRAGRDSILSFVFRKAACR